MILEEVCSGSVRTPQRPADLIHIHQAVQAAAQKGLAHTRQWPERLIDTGWGWVLQQAAAERKWLGPPDSITQHCHLVDVVEADADFGVQIVLNRQVADIAAGAFAAVCPYFEVPAAAKYIRIDCLGEKVNVWSHAAEIRRACDIPERAVNDSRLPSSAEISGGTLLRLDAASAKTLCQYLNLPGDSLWPQFTLHELGANFYALYAVKDDTREPARMILSAGCTRSIAERELKRWLKSSTPRRRKTSGKSPS
jgi:hypothetical protein